MKFPPYPRYKDSGVEWLGEVPEHWEVLRNKVIFKEIDERSSTGDEELLTVSHITGVTPRSEKEVNMFLAETLEGYKKSKRGDLIINTMWAFMGALGVTNYDGVVSPSYNVYRPRIQGKVHPKYLDHLYRTPNHIIEILRFSKGIWDSRLRLYPDAFLSMRLSLPPYKEQEEIVGYLDRETLKIDELIGKQERLITLLKEKKQALISHAVTKGLNPNVPRKDSGIAWLGDIPKHWELWKIAHAYPNIGSGTTPPSDEQKWYDGEFAWVTTGELREKVITETTKTVTAEALKKFSALKVHPKGSILIAMYGATIGRVAVLGIEATTNQACCALPKSTILDNDFVFYWLIGCRNEILFLAYGAGQPNISQDLISGLRVSAPPLSEQKEITAYLDRETAKIDALMDKARQAIELLQEHRTTLISSAITGKIDVRQYRNGNLSNH